MPLDPASLTTGLTGLFSDPPSTAAECAAEWASSMKDYAIAIIPASTTVETAAQVLETNLTGIFETSLDENVTAVQMETAFLTFATSVGAGMQPAYTATPPPGLIDFATLFSARPETHAQAASDFVGKIDPWMRTGTAKLNSPPMNTVNWT